MHTRRQFLCSGLVAAGGAITLDVIDGNSASSIGARTNPSPAVVVETFRGTAGDAFLATLTRGRPKVSECWTRSRSDLASRGFTLAGDLTVVTRRRPRLGGGGGRSLVSIANAETVYDPEGVMVVETWQSNDDTWTGSVYWENQDVNAWAHASTQLNVQQTNYPDILWTQGNGAGGEGGSTQQPRSWHGIPCDDEIQIAAELSRSAWSNGWQGIIGSAVGCLVAPPWFLCWTAWSLGSLAGGGFISLREWWQQCGCRYVDQACP